MPLKYVNRVPLKDSKENVDVAHSGSDGEKLDLGL